MASKSKSNLLVLGTGSHVGKSLVVAGLCRLLSRKGVRVAPFKAQNMALNSGVTPDGGEIGRAQMLQARAAGCSAKREMNPVLLKPVLGQGSQVILNGQAYRHMSTQQYYRFWPKAAQVARHAYQTLSQEFEFVVMEGAGSPAEINFATRDLANLEAARFSQAPWVLVVDIERGGSFAAILGTLALVPGWLKKNFKGVLINKFRGKLSLLEPGLQWLEQKKKVPVLGVLPYLDKHGLEEEDSLGLPDNSLYRNLEKALKIEIIRHNHISNFNDFLPLQAEAGIQIFWKKPGQSSPWKEPDLILLPGSKNSLDDLWDLQRSGEARRIKALVRLAGSWVVGLCGGYQMLGTWLEDAGRHDSGFARGNASLLGRKGYGLGLLNLETRMEAIKTLALSQAQANLPFGRFRLKGYEIHMGQSRVGKGSLACFGKGSHGFALGARNRSGRVWGTYLHGVFENDSFRKSFLMAVAKSRGIKLRLESRSYQSELENKLDAWADHVGKHLDLARLFKGSSVGGLFAGKG